MLVAAAALAMVAFALEGGEYGTRDLRALRRQANRERARIDSLRHAVDSLGRLKRELTTDSAAQERAARSQFGMIRDGERLYQVVQDTAR